MATFNKSLMCHVFIFAANVHVSNHVRCCFKTTALARVCVCLAVMISSVRPHKTFACSHRYSRACTERSCTGRSYHHRTTQTLSCRQQTDDTFRSTYYVILHPGRYPHSSVSVGEFRTFGGKDGGGKEVNKK